MQILNILRLAEHLTKQSPPSDPEQLHVHERLLALSARGLELAMRVSQSSPPDELPRIMAGVEDALSRLAPSVKETDEHHVHLASLRIRIQDDLWLQQFTDEYDGRIEELAAARTAHRKEHRERVQRRGDPIELQRELARLSAEEREELRRDHPRLIARVEWLLRQKRL